MASLKKIPASGVKGILAHNDRQEGFFLTKISTPAAVI